MALRKGLDNLQSTGSFTNYERPNFVSWKNGEQKIIRFLTTSNEVLVPYIHDNVECADGKRRGFLCRKELQKDCPLCDNDVRRRQKGYGIVALRSQVKGEKGNKIVDVMQTYTATDSDSGASEESQRPLVAIIDQSPSNFWEYLYAIEREYKEEYGEEEGSWVNYDIKIRRDGQGRDTKYIAFPQTPKPISFDHYTPHMPDLESFIERLGGDRYYSRNLPELAQAYGISVDDNGSSQNQPKPAPSSDTETSNDDDDNPLSVFMSKGSDESASSTETEADADDDDDEEDEMERLRRLRKEMQGE